MALIERFTPGGNLYPDGQSTFVFLVDVFRKLAENRDTRDAAQRTAWKQDDTTTLTAAKTYTDNAVANVDVDLTGYATETYAATAAGTAESNAKNYTDTSFAASGPGGATDTQVDAAVERAVLAGRIGTVTLTQVAVGVFELTTV